MALTQPAAKAASRKAERIAITNQDNRLRQEVLRKLLEVIDGRADRLLATKKE